MSFQSKKIFIILSFFLVIFSCGYKPIFKNMNSEKMLQNNITFIYEENKENYHISETLLKHFGYPNNPQISVEIISNISKKSEIITSSNETTSYNLIIDVKYIAYDDKKKKIKTWVSTAKTSYSATSTYTGYATEVAEKEALKRLSETIAEEIILNLTVDLINYDNTKN